MGEVQKYFLCFIFLLSFVALLNSCISHQYQVAQKNKEKPWGKYAVEVENQESQLLEIYKLKKNRP